MTGSICLCIEERIAVYTVTITGTPVCQIFSECSKREGPPYWQVVFLNRIGYYHNGVCIIMVFVYYATKDSRYQSHFCDNLYMYVLSFPISSSGMLCVAGLCHSRWSPAVCGPAATPWLWPSILPPHGPRTPGPVTKQHNILQPTGYMPTELFTALKVHRIVMLEIMASIIELTTIVAWQKKSHEW